MTGRRNGFVLINALVIVAALSLAVLWMLSRAESARVRSAAAVQAAQLQLYLDGFETLARDMLEQDQTRTGAVDQHGETWAKAIPPVTLDRGRVTGEIIDLQGLFNLNQLADPENEKAHAAFEKLARRQGLSSRKARAIIDFLSPDGPAKARSYAEAELPMRPVGGSLLMREQLRMIPLLSARDYARLAPLVTALPGRTAINVNTASAEVMASLFPGVEAAQFGGLVAEARRSPFQSVESFHIALLRVVSPAVVEDLPQDAFSVGSAWFEVSIEAELDGRRARRRATIRRLSLSQRPVVAYRLDNWN